MSSEIIQAIVALGTGGGLVTLYNAIAKNRRAKREQDEEPEKFIRQLLIDQVDELSSTVESIRVRLEEMLQTNAKLEVERRQLMIENQKLLTQNSELMKENHKLLKENSELLRLIKAQG